MKQRFAIDPGDVHIGWAHWYISTDGNWKLDTGEWTPDQTPDEIVHRCTRQQIDEFVIERFSLYAGETLPSQIGSAMKTSQMIGAVKLIARMFRVPWVEQGADIKNPTRGQLRGRGIKQVAVGSHARDAELHLYYRRLREDRK